MTIPKRLSFQSRLERISEEVNYFAVPVPAKITGELGTKGPVLVSARVNGSKAFRVSLHPVGGGRHSIRVKAEIRNEVKVQEGDRVRMEITVLDRAAEATLPKDLASALRAEGVLKDFESLPVGKRGFIIRKIDEAAKPETRKKRIQEAVEEAHRRREKRVDQA